MRGSLMEHTSEQIYHKSLKAVKSAVLDAFRDQNITIFLFGSRARGDFNRHSDLDIGILPKQGYDRKKLVYLKDKLENLNIPYKVDVIDMSTVSDVFREKALKEGEIWKN
jgi:predicted nucleotidyltransferase